MSSTALCRLCLAMNAPVHDIADTPLQSVYEKLTDTSLDAAPGPLTACYLCHCQLRKCHDLMVRCLKANEVFTHLLRSAEGVSVEFITTKHCEIQKRNELIVTPLELIVIAGPEHSPINANIKRAPLSPQCKEEIEAEEPRSIDCLTFDESLEDDFNVMVQRDVESIENGGWTDRGQITEQLGNVANIKRDELPGAGNIMKEKQTYVRKCIGYLKFEDSEGEDDNDRNKTTVEENTKHEQPLSSQRCIDYLKFEDSEHEEDSEREIPMTVEDIENEETTDGQHIEDAELEDAADTKSMEAAGAAPDERCKETHAENIQDRSTSTPGGKNILEKPKAIVEETSIDNGCYISQSTENANNRHVSTTSSTYADTAIDKYCASVGNEHSRTNTDVDITSRRMFICNDCGKIFDDKYLLIEHIDRHDTVKKTSYRNSLPQRTLLRKEKFSRTGTLVNKHTKTQSEKKPVQCNICQRRFTAKSVLKGHLLTHTEFKPFECEIYEMKFSQSGYLLKTHLRVHTKEKPFECEICKVRFSQKGNLQRHIRVHTKEKPFECEICKRRFSHKGSLIVHLRVHTKEKPYECEICKVSFSRKGHLNVHLRVHTKEKPYECEICKRRFSQKGSLIVHLRVHTKEKPYECEICKVRFSEKGALKKHLRVHTKEKPYECEICKVRFSQKHSLNVHLRVHTKEKPYECEICKVRFSQKRSLNVHLRVHTKEKPYECDICKVRFSGKGSIKRHLTIHTKEKPYECEICKVRFNRMDHLKIHLRVHTKEKPYECEICKVRFARMDHLKIHLRVHTKEKPYECEICKVRFSEKRSLKTHLRVHTKEKS